MPQRLTLSYIPNSQLVFIKHTAAEVEKGKHSSASLVSAKKKKGGGGVGEVELRSPAFLNHVSLWLRLPVSLEAWTLISQITGEAERMC